MSLNDAAIIPVKRNDYRLHIWYMSKDELIIISIYTIFIFFIKDNHLLSNIKDEQRNYSDS